MSMSANQKARAMRGLEAAVKAARDAADLAERNMRAAANDPGRAAQAVMHALAWGHANAMSGVESAMAATEDMHTFRAVEAQQSYDSHE